MKAPHLSTLFISLLVLFAACSESPNVATESTTEYTAAAQSDGVLAGRISALTIRIIKDARIRAMVAAATAPSSLI